LTIPLLLWQNARRITYGDWQSSYIGMIYWLVVVILYSLLFAIGDVLLWPGAILFGLIVASVIWWAGMRLGLPSFKHLKSLWQAVLRMVPSAGPPAVAAGCAREDYFICGRSYNHCADPGAFQPDRCRLPA